MILTKADEELTQEAISVEYPATERQKASWKEHIDGKKKIILNICEVLHLNTPNATAIEKALRELAARHESLRTHFIMGSDGLRQVIHPSDQNKLKLEKIDLRKSIFSKFRARRTVQSVIKTMFDLGKAPLVRSVLVQWAKDKAILVIAMHHIVSDASSIVIFRQELLDYYQSFIDQRPIERAPLKFQIKDFAIWEKNFLASARGAKNLSYWLEELGGDIPQFQLRPYWKGNRKWETSWRKKNAGSYISYISRPLLEEIKSLVIDLKTSRLCIFYTALISLMYHLSHQNEMIIVVPISLRDRQDLKNVIGYLNTDIYLKVNITGDKSLQDLIATVSDKYFKALDHRHHPIEKVLSRSQNLSAAVLNELPPKDELIKNFEPYFLTKNNGRETLFPFFFMLCEYKNGLQINCVYSRTFISDGKIEKVLCQFTKLLELMVKNPSTEISHLIESL